MHAVSRDLQCTYLWARHWVAARQGKVRRMRPSPFNKGSGAAKQGAAAAKPGAAAAPQRMVTLSEADDSDEVGLRGPASLDHCPAVPCMICAPRALRQPLAHCRLQN